eukprot:5032050-Amphidinium_carterae.3
MPAAALAQFLEKHGAALQPRSFEHVQHALTCSSKCHVAECKPTPLQVAIAARCLTASRYHLPR